MAEPQPFDFVDRSLVPARVWGKDASYITERLRQMKESLGVNLVKTVLYPNVGHVTYGTGESLGGAVHYFKRGTPVSAILPFIGPLYQHTSVFNLGKLSDEKIKSSSDAWNLAIDPPQTRGSGIPGVGLNDSSDLIQSYIQRGKVNAEWSTSLGTKYPALAGIYRSPDGQCKLFITGGHEAIHMNLLTTIASKKDLKIEDLADRKFALESESSMNQVISAVKDMQKINHSFMASKILAIFGDSRTAKVASDPYTNFESPVELSYSCFVNTVHEAQKQKGSVAEVYALTQGVVDTQTDIEVVDRNSDKLNLYLVESPLRVHELQVNREYLNLVHYFPLTTGSSEKHNGMADSDRDTLKAGLSWTGVLGIHNAADLYYQPYDTTLKLHTNALFSNQCFAIVDSDIAMEGVIYTVTGLDARPLTTEDYLNHTQHLGAEEIVRAPATSAPVKMIFDTFPTVLDELKKQGRKTVELFKVIKTDDVSNHFVQFPIGSLRIAQEYAKKVNVASPVDSLQGLPKLVKQ